MKHNGMAISEGNFLGKFFDLATIAPIYSFFSNFFFRSAKTLTAIAMMISVFDFVVGSAYFFQIILASLSIVFHFFYLSSMLKYIDPSKEKL